MVTATPPRSVGDKKPTTRCTNCQTVFELPPELLESADTRVRCGECLCIFDARDGLISPAAAAKLRAAATSKAADAKASGADTSPGASSSTAPTLNDTLVVEDPATLDVTYSDFDLFSEDADLPALAYFDETRDTPEFDFDSVELQEDDTFSETMFSHDVTINADLPLSADNPDNAGQIEPAALQIPPAEVDFSVQREAEEPLIFNYADPPANAPTANALAADEEVQHEQHKITLGRTAVVDRAAKEATKAAAKAVAIKTKSKLFQREPGGALPSETSIAPTRTNTQRSAAGVWFGGVLLLLGVLVATVVYPRWSQFDQSPTYRPIKMAFCNVMGCRVDTRIDIDQLKVLRREVFQAPNLDNALLISIAIQNTAAFAQRFPVVEARMTDRVGRTVAQRAFKPAEYLENWNRGDTLAASETVDISLTVNDPGAAAEHHVLQLRPLRLDCEPLTTPAGQQRWPIDCAEL